MARSIKTGSIETPASFSFACDGVRDVIRDHPAWETAQELARAVLDGKAIWLEEIGSATHYHANYV